MTKSAIEDYDETVANNTDADGEPISDSTRAVKVDNLFRIIMSHLAKFTGADTLDSAVSTDLGSVPGRYVVMTGTTTATALGTIKDGTIKTVKFSGALTLTHNATSLILPGGANITTAAGDVFEFVSEGSGNWRCTGYALASGEAISGGVSVLDEDDFASDSATQPPSQQSTDVRITSKVHVVDSVVGTYATNTNLTTAIPYDDTIPQSSEGTQIISVAITPKTTTNKLRARFTAFGAVSTTAHVISALFLNSDTDAVAASAQTNSGDPDDFQLSHEWTPGSTSEQTIKIRVGPTTGTLRLNGTTSARRFGGVAKATLVVEEILAS